MEHRPLGSSGLDVSALALGSWRETFGALLDWLAPRSATGTVVQTTAQVVGGPVQPPVLP